MREPEAIAVLREQLMGEDGFIGKLHHGRGIDNQLASKVISALETLEIAWMERSSLEKASLLPLLDIYGQMMNAAPLYPGQEDEIRDLAISLSDHVDRAVLGQQSTLTEEEAMAIVWSHMTSQESFLRSLHVRNLPDREAVAQLKLGLQDLAKYWAVRNEVPRSIAGPMLSTHIDIEGWAGQNPDEYQEIERLGDEVTELVRRCLK
jgi:hypothetical protein